MLFPGEAQDLKAFPTHTSQNLSAAFVTSEQYFYLIK